MYRIQYIIYSISIISIGILIYNKVLEVYIYRLQYGAGGALPDCCVWPKTSRQC